MAAAPASEKELLERATSLTGKSLQQLAIKHDLPVPGSLIHAKGWLGNLLELELGASAGVRPEPDFMQLGIELKTLPLNRHGMPKESTYVCVAQLERGLLGEWEQSLVKRKLAHVLWIPYEADNDIAIGARHIGNPISWKPDSQQEQQLREDWQEITDMICMGNIAEVTSSMGRYLQIRPKAANAAAQTIDHNQAEAHSVTLPRGFYLRSSFTRQILNNVGKE